VPVAAAIALPPWPRFDPDEIAAATAALESGRVNYWTGDECRAFEREWGEYHGLPPGISMANGSLSLDAAVKLLGIGPGDEVIVSPRSYVASAMCVVLAGATPVFADIDPDSGCVTPATLEAARTPRTKAAIPVHIGGWPCDMPAIAEWADSQGIQVIEDCAQAHGARIGTRKLGTWGIFASWSFCQDKIMTTGGEGGMLTTRDDALHQRAWAYSQHGKDPKLTSAASGPGGAHGFRWLVRHEGTNLRMTEMQAAIGRCQLRKLDHWVSLRARNSRIMRDHLRAFPCLRVPEPPEGHAHYRCTAFVDGRAEEAGPLRDRILASLRDRGVPAMHGSCSEIYREHFFESKGLAPRAPLPVARLLGETSLTFLVHHTIDEPAMRAYAESAAEAISQALK
jgi:dTDP-4-amino-4,6-dideoxygalactose transaminase